MYKRFSPHFSMIFCKLSSKTLWLSIFHYLHRPSSIFFIFISIILFGLRANVEGILTVLFFITYSIITNFVCEYRYLYEDDNTASKLPFLLMLKHLVRKDTIISAIISIIGVGVYVLMGSGWRESLILVFSLIISFIPYIRILVPQKIVEWQDDRFIIIMSMVFRYAILSSIVTSIILGLPLPVTPPQIMLLGLGSTFFLFLIRHDRTKHPEHRIPHYDIETSQIQILPRQWLIYSIAAMCLICFVILMIMATMWPHGYIPATSLVFLTFGAFLWWGTRRYHIRSSLWTIFRRYSFKVPFSWLSITLFFIYLVLMQTPLFQRAFDFIQLPVRYWILAILVGGTIILLDQLWGVIYWGAHTSRDAA